MQFVNLLFLVIDTPLFSYPEFLIFTSYYFTIITMILIVEEIFYAFTMFNVGFIRNIYKIEMIVLILCVSCFPENRAFYFPVQIS